MHVTMISVFPILFPLITGAEKQMVPRGTQTKIFFFNTDDEHDQRVYASLSSIAGLGGEELEEVEGDTSPKSAVSPPPSSSDTPPPPPPPPSPLRENGVVSGVLAHGRVLAPPRPPPPSNVRAVIENMVADGGESGRSSVDRSLTPLPPPPPSATQEVVDGNVDDERFRLPPPLPRDESVRRGKAPARPPPPPQGFNATGNGNQGLSSSDLPTVGADRDAKQGFPSLTANGLGMPMPVHYFNGQNPLITLPFPALPELRDNANDDDDADDNAS